VKITFNFLIISLFLASCQRKTNPPPKTCPSGQVKVGDSMCAESPLGGPDTGGQTTETPAERKARLERQAAEQQEALDAEAKRLEEERIAARGGAGTGDTPAGGPSTYSEMPENPNLADTPFEPPAPTPEEVASSGGSDSTSVDSYKDLEVIVTIKAVPISESERGPLGIYVKLSKPDLVSNIYVQYMKGEVVEGDKAFAPWDIFATIKFNAGALHCEVSETRFDWETYRTKEPSLMKPVPYSCRTRSSN